jgi:hypothetical protein
MKNTWWVEYQYNYEFQDFETNEYIKEEDFDSGRFKCLKKDIPNEVKEYVEKYDLYGEKYRNLQIKILDKYITSDCEL